MSEIVYVFVSSTWLDLQPERKAVEKAMQRMKDTKLIAMEYFGSRDDTTRTVSLHEVDGSQVYIGIFGGRYGSGITEDEYRRAREKGLTCRVYFKNDSTITEEEREQEADKAAKLAALKAELRRDHTICEFSNPSDLAAMVTADLHNWLVETKRATRAGLIPVDLSRILKYAPAELIGREDELKLLNDAWLKVRQAESPRSRIITFVALGGEGKTSLVAKWAAELASQDWPGCDAAFAWSFYSQGTREQVAASADLFLKEALTFFGDDKDREFATSPAGAYEKGQRLARIAGQRRCLLILDGMEPLQYPPTCTAFEPGKLKDEGIAKLLKDLAASSQGLCIVTTRCSLLDLKAFWQSTAPENTLQRLSRGAGVCVLKAHGIIGSDRRTVPLGHGSQELVSEFEKLVEDVDGHALTLHIMGSYLKKSFRGDIRCRDRVSFEKASKKSDNDHAMRAMAAYARWMEDGSDDARRELAILRLMGLFDRPADAGCVAALLQEPAIPGLTDPLVGLCEEDWNTGLGSLESAKLLTVSEETAALSTSLFALPTFLDAHPLLREYFACQLHEKNLEAWHLANSRLFEYLRECPDPQTLQEMEPLLRAVGHGCAAGMAQKVFDEVYFPRITRGANRYWITSELGAHGSDLSALASFFDRQWDKIKSKLCSDSQAFIFNAVGYDLGAVGRLKDAIAAMEKALEIHKDDERWKEASIDARCLCNQSMLYGDVRKAVAFGEDSVFLAGKTYAEKRRLEWQARAMWGSALYYHGDFAAATDLFSKAEQIFREVEHRIPFMNSVFGFRHCELLLEKAASLDEVKNVVDRADQILTLARNTLNLRDIGLTHLSFGSALVKLGNNWSYRRSTTMTPCRYRTETRW